MSLDENELKNRLVRDAYARATEQRLARENTEATRLASTSNRGPIENLRESDNRSNGSSTGTSEPRPIPPSTDNRWRYTRESNERGTNGNVDTTSGEYRQFTGSNGGDYQRNERPTESTLYAVEQQYTDSQSSVYEPPAVGKSRNAFANIGKNIGGIVHRGQEIAAPYIQETFGGGSQQNKKSTGTGGSQQSKTAPRGKTLSDKEAQDIRAKLIETIIWESDHADQFIIATTTGHDPAIIIWSNLDMDDATILADFLLLQGKKHPPIAGAVRQMLEIKTLVQVGLITVPRAVMTIATYLQRGFSIKY